MASNKINMLFCNFSMIFPLDDMFHPFPSLIVQLSSPGHASPGGEEKGLRRTVAETRRLGGGGKIPSAVTPGIVVNHGSRYISVSVTHPKKNITHIPTQALNKSTQHRILKWISPVFCFCGLLYLVAIRGMHIQVIINGG
jgi:hypothetical protein